LPTLNPRIREDPRVKIYPEENKMLPIHPFIVHWPLALAFLMPLLSFVFALGIKKQWIKPKFWLVIIILQATVVGSGYLAMETGEDEEEKVEKMIDKKAIHEHEERAEVFIALSVVSLVLTIVTILLKEKWRPMLALLSSISLAGASFAAFRTGEAGGALVYQYGAANAYSQIIPKSSDGTSTDSESIEEEEDEVEEENE
jgi:uncharacterized membrane protein